MTADLKTVLVDALNASAIRGIRHRELNPSTITAEGSDHAYYTDYDADRLATALRDHFLDREKVRAALKVVLDHHHSEEFAYSLRGHNDQLVDRLIECLAGKASG
ncbi:hypothetical protein [Brevundimonas sp. NPDC058933]|uniref:hypothetical protein n=1 Tax=Brevundimonas sp. NPDC058933 TaxID=3346673 RepID=UPI003BEF375C